jgi:phosphomevalonate kinase
MPEHDWSAPGKMVVSGEYAVLDGHTALVAAVSPRAVVERQEAPRLSLRGNGPLVFEVAAQRLEALQALPLLMAVCDEVGRHSALPNSGRYFVDTSSFAVGGTKVGLGSSAAAAVALSRSLLPHATLDTVFSVARTAHRNFQGGGSGLDIAASCHGGLVAFSLRDGVPHVATVSSFPRGIALHAVFVGHATDTQGFVDAYRALHNRGSFAAAISEASRHVLLACEQNDSEAFLAAIDAARVAMDALGRAAAIPVVSALHQQVAAIAHDCGGAGKPSGAGGGDVALCAVPTAASERLVSSLRAAGFHPLDLQFAVDGARIGT